MDARQFTEAAERLERALREAGILVERAESVHGQLRYTPVPPEALLGRLLQIGLRVSLVGPAAVSQGDGDPGT